MKKLIYSFIFVLFLSSASYAAPAYYKINYLIQKGDTFAVILKRFVKNNSVIDATTPMVKRTRKSNRHIKNWRKMPPGVVMSIYISPKYFDRKKYKKYTKIYGKKIAKIKKKNSRKKKGSLPYGFKGSLFYMASYGQFNQSDPGIAEVTFLQNSPASLGASGSYYPKKKLYSFTSSLYYSHLYASKSNASDGYINIPGEIGLNLYEQYRLPKYSIVAYGGLDYEKFSSFNLEHLTGSGSLVVDTNNVFYGTIGVSRSITLFKKNFFAKFSLSWSLYATQTVGVGESDSPFSGYRLLWYLNTKVSSKFFIHTLVKYHKLSGASDLTVIRGGIGFGYIL